MKKYDGVNWEKLTKEQQNELLKDVKFIDSSTGVEIKDITYTDKLTKPLVENGIGCGYCTVRFANGLETGGVITDNGVFIDGDNIIIAEEY